MALTVREIKYTEINKGDKPKRLYDAGGLYLYVTHAGKYWRYNYRLGGKRKTLSLGRYPDIPLAGKRGADGIYRKGVRELHADAKLKVSQGIDPSFEKQQIKKANIERAKLQMEQETVDINTFNLVAHNWMQHQKHRLEDSYSSKVEGRIKNYLAPRLGEKPIRIISKADAVSCIEAVVQEGKYETAKRLFQMLRSIFDYAYARDLIDAIPMPSDHKLIIPAFTSKKMPAITDINRIGELLRAIDGYSGAYVSSMALKITPYVALRSGEFRKAHWSDVDLDRGLWVIPAKNRKLKKHQKQDEDNIHLVPLAHQVVEMLSELKKVTGHGDLIFPSVRTNSRPISDNTVNSALHTLGFKGEVVAHGFRSIFSTIMNQAGYNPDAIERQLAHSSGDQVRDAYNRAAYLVERENIMQTYADYLDLIRSGDTDKLPDKLVSGVQRQWGTKA